MNIVGYVIPAVIIGFHKFVILLKISNVVWCVPLDAFEARGLELAKGNSFIEFPSIFCARVNNWTFLLALLLGKGVNLD